MGDEIVIGLGNYRESSFKPGSKLKGNSIHLGTAKYSAYGALTTTSLYARVTSLCKANCFRP